MSEELVKSVQDMLNEEKWTRAAISNYTKNQFIEFAILIEKAREANCLDEVKAICDGEITEVKDDTLWGTIVTINHSNGIIATYSGLQKDSTLKPGATVKANEKIGLLGEIPIEKDDGIHLHLEIMKDGNAVSPSDYLGKSVDI